MGNFNHSTHLQVLPGTGNRGPHAKSRYFLEIRNRYKWLLDMGGEQVLLYKRKFTGERCPLYDQVRRRSQRHGQDTLCFGPSTLVRTSKGYMPIESVSVGDLVLSDDGNFYKVSKTFASRYEGKLIKLRTTSMTRPVLVTPDHPIMGLYSTHRDTITSCRPGLCNTYINNAFNIYQSFDIRRNKKGEYIARAQKGSKRDGNRRYLGTFSSEENAKTAILDYRMSKVDTKHSLEWLTASELSLGSWVQTVIPKKIDTPLIIEVPTKFRKTSRLEQARKGDTFYDVDEEFLWMIGLYLAEGSSTAGKSGSINFSLHETETVYRDRIISYFTKKGFNPRVCRGKDTKGIQVTVASSMLGNWFKTWLGNGCENKHIPEELMYLPENMVIHLLQGIYDGDGNKSDPEIGQTSEVLSSQIRELFQRIGHQPLIRLQRSKTKTSNGNDRKLCYVNSWGTNPNHINRKGRWAFENDTVLSKVIEYEEVPYSGFVYNLEVEERNTYVVQDMLVHNCFGTGYVGGYFKPIPIVVRLVTDRDEQAVIEEWGRRRIYKPRSWTLWEPILINGDVIVRRNNQRLWITRTIQRRWKHFITRQDFETKEIDRGDPVYKLPT